MVFSFRKIVRKYTIFIWGFQNKQNSIAYLSVTKLASELSLAYKGQSFGWFSSDFDKGTELRFILFDFHLHGQYKT